MQDWVGGVGGVDDVDVAAAHARGEQEAARLLAVAVATGASVPAAVVQFVADLRHFGARDY